MNTIKLSNIKRISIKYVILTCLMGLHVLLPQIMKISWFSVVAWMRDSLHSGDGGQLILASASLNLSYGLIGIITYAFVILSIRSSRLHADLSIVSRRILIIFGCIVMRFLSWKLLQIPFEIMTEMVALITLSFMAHTAKLEFKSLISEFIIAIQVIIAMQWVNTMPAMTAFRFGVGDLPASVKLAGLYLGTDVILNIVSLSFLCPLLLSATMTVMRFRANRMYTVILEENYQKARDLELAQTKIMENRMYQEVNAMAHDLKTPLVTIRGLNSMLMLSQDISKLGPYTERIEGAVEKMNELISGFLYENYRQPIRLEELLNNVRAQLPIEDESMRFRMDNRHSDVLINGNKIRLSRAIINIVENAIIASAGLDERFIKIITILDGSWILLEIIDNGRGIPPEDLNKVFNIGHSRTNTTGLGLPYAKKMIEENDGEIRLNSVLNSGTTVTIRLPIYSTLS